MKKIKSLKVMGKRWFQRSYGNTYHTATVVVNGEELKSDVTYGYGNYYLQTAVDLLRSAGYDLPENDLEAFKIVTSYAHDVQDVKRKKEL